MKRFKAVAATMMPCLNEYQPPMTLENLKKFIDHKAPITLDYHMDTHVGNVTKAWVEDNKLMVEGEIIQEELLEQKGMYCAISFKANVQEDAVEVLDPMYYAFTTFPADTGTTPVEIIND